MGTKARIQCTTPLHGAMHCRCHSWTMHTERLVGRTTIRHHIVRKKKSSAPVGKQAAFHAALLQDRCQYQLELTLGLIAIV